MTKSFLDSIDAAEQAVANLKPGWAMVQNFLLLGGCVGSRKVRDKHGKYATDSRGNPIELKEEVTDKRTGKTYQRVVIDPPIMMVIPMPATGEAWEAWAGPILRDCAKAQEAWVQKLLSDEEAAARREEQKQEAFREQARRAGITIKEKRGRAKLYGRLDDDAPAITATEIEFDI